MPELSKAAAAAGRELAAAFAAIAAADPETLADMRAATEIPSPLEGEARRALWFVGRLREEGLEVRTDAAGNVLAQWGPGDVSQSLVLASHLDTVFGPDTVLCVAEREGRFWAPGISDNSRGLAALLRLAAVLPRLPALRHPVLLAGTVGEEGAGDLRGVKHLFDDPRFRPAAFVAVDGAGRSRVVHRAVGSRRLRIDLAGPGGHSWSDRGGANPLHALSAAVAALEEVGRPADADVAINVGRMGGGTSVNAIPEHAWLELDLRSESEPAIAELERAARRLFEAAARPPLQLVARVMGDRPGGATPAEHPLVQAAVAATRELGASPELVASSTDANVAMALGIPAIAIGAGGEAGGMHTLEEWYSNDGGVAGIQRLALTLILADRLL